MGFQASTLFQSWASSLRIKWLSFKGRAQALAYATVLGDWTVDWMIGALLERMPLQASATALALIASERQLDVAPSEATSSIAQRATQWIQLGKYVGTPIGILLGMHFAGFEGGVFAQQNGIAYQLQLPLPAIVAGQPWDPTPNLIRVPCDVLAVALTSSVTPPTMAQAGRSIPAGNSWFTLDSNTDACSRFAILFPTPPSNFPFSSSDQSRLVNLITKWRPARATCTGITVVTTGQAFGWPVQTWGARSSWGPFASTVYAGF